MRKTPKIVLYLGLFFSQAVGVEKIAVFSAGAVGLVDIETDAISVLIEDELEATELYAVIERTEGEAPLTFIKEDRSALGRIASNIWKATSDTLDPSVGKSLDGAEVVIWRLNRSGRTYNYDFRLYTVEIDRSEGYTYQGERLNKRYLKGKARTTSRFTGSAEDAAEAARLMAWQVVGLKPPNDRFGRGFRVGMLDGLRRAYNTFWFVADSGFESLLILVALLIMGGALSSAIDSGEDLGYPPDYPGVP